MINWSFFKIKIWNNCLVTDILSNGVTLLSASKTSILLTIDFQAWGPKEWTWNGRNFLVGHCFMGNAGLQNLSLIKLF